MTYSYKPAPRRRSLEAMLVGLALVLLSAVPALADELSVRVTDQRGTLLEDAVIYVTRADGSSINSDIVPPKSVDQINTRFSPKVTVIPVGASLFFDNSDTITHHVYSFSEAKKLDIRVDSGSRSAEYRFDKPGVIALGCNIHDDMSAFIYVAPSKLYAITGKDGIATFDTLAAGTYRIWAWHPRALRLRTTDMAVNIDGKTEVDMTLRARAKRKKRGGRGNRKRY